MEASAQISEAFEQHRERVLSFCARLTGDQLASEDIAQDVFLKALEDGNSDVAWLYTCARNRCIDFMRRRSVWSRVKTRISQSLGWLPGFESALVDRDLGAKVLNKLTPKMRSVLLLKAYAGMSYEEIAKELGTTTETVGVTLSRARARAREILSEEEGL